MVMWSVTRGFAESIASAHVIETRTGIVVDVLVLLHQVTGRRGVDGAFFVRDGRTPRAVSRRPGEEFAGIRACCHALQIRMGMAIRALCGEVIIRQLSPSDR